MILDNAVKAFLKQNSDAVVINLGAGLDTRRTVREWAGMGVRRADGHPMPAADVDASILVPAGHTGPAFMVYENFGVIMGWNRSEFYALSVGYLADRIAGAGRLRISPPDSQQPMSLDTVAEMQAMLSAAGYDTGGTDGILGPATRRAIGAFQRDAGLIADGYPNGTTLEQLRALEADDR
jgi:membrane-bound lytic murein transglycosylase B